MLFTHVRASKEAEHQLTRMWVKVRRTCLTEPCVDADSQLQTTPKNLSGLMVNTDKIPFRFSSPNTLHPPFSSITGQGDTCLRPSHVAGLP